MNLKNKLHSFFLISITLCSLNVASQTRSAFSDSERKNIKVKSINGETIDVTVIPDYVTMSIILYSNSDTLCVNNDFTGLKEDIKILGENFIVLHYEVRCGTGCRTEKITLVCLSDKKFSRALDIISLDSYVFDKTYNKLIDSLYPVREIGIYTLDLVNLTNSNHEYILKAKVYEKIESRKNPANDHEATDTIAFKFDKKNKVFYTEYKELKGTFETEDKRNKTIKGIICPMLKAKNTEYYFWDNKWYWQSKDRGDRIFRVSATCE